MVEIVIPFLKLKLKYSEVGLLLTQIGVVTGVTLSYSSPAVEDFPYDSIK
jgi:hypothetical protein